MAGNHRSPFSAPVGHYFKKYHSILGLFSFTLFVVSNTLFSHAHLPWLLKAWVAILGLLGPLALLLALKEKTDPLQEEPGLSLGLKSLSLLFLAAAFIRLYRLFVVAPWPLSDEGLFGYFAVMLGEKWDWQLLQCPAQEPALYSWGQALFFGLFGHSLFSFWLFPALCSLVCVPLLWMAASKAFSRSTAFLLAGWMAFSFWPLYLGWFSLQQILLVLWECATLWALAIYWKEGPQGHRIYPLAVLTGTGFYTYWAWPFVALLVGLTILAKPRMSYRRRLTDLLRFLAITAFLLLPLVISLSKEYRGYFNYLWAFGTPHDLFDRLRLPWSCLCDFFWGAPQDFFHYGPVWGGFLNPILGTLFFLGFLHFLRRPREPLSLWIFSAFFVLFLPTLLTNNFEIMRLTPMIPLLLFICAAGTQNLLAFLPTRQRPLVLILLFAFSTFLDVFHLIYVYPKDEWARTSYYSGAKTLEYEKAYGFLKTSARDQGPGLILLNFQPDPYDQTLFVATYDFNAAENPVLNPDKARWAAIVSNIHEEPFFQKLFPEGKWSWLSEGLNHRDGGYILEMIPVNSNTKTLLGHWVKADGSLKELTRLVMDRGVTPDQEPMMEVLEKAYPSFKGDPFLESRYWRIAALHYAAEGKRGEAIEAYQWAIGKGLPMAHLYNEMGCLMSKEKKLEGAQKAFKNALGLKLNLTNAQENLKNLQKL